MTTRLSAPIGPQDIQVLSAAADRFGAAHWSLMIQGQTYVIQHENLASGNQVILNGVVVGRGGDLLSMQNAFTFFINHHGTMIPIMLVIDGDSNSMYERFRLYAFGLPIHEISTSPTGLCLLYLLIPLLVVFTLFFVAP